MVVSTDRIALLVFIFVLAIVGETDGSGGTAVSVAADGFSSGDLLNFIDAVLLLAIVLFDVVSIAGIVPTVCKDVSVVLAVTGSIVTADHDEASTSATLFVEAVSTFPDMVIELVSVIMRVVSIA